MRYMLRACQSALQKSIIQAYFLNMPLYWQLNKWITKIPEMDFLKSETQNLQLASQKPLLKYKKTIDH